MFCRRSACPHCHIPLAVRDGSTGGFLSHTGKSSDAPTVLVPSTSTSRIDLNSFASPCVDRHQHFLSSLQSSEQLVRIVL
eukprot:180856-Amphidinium_carterae.1